MVVVADEGLFEFGDVEERGRGDLARELREEGDVFGDVAGKLAEFRVVFNEPLHVVDGFDLGVRLGFGLVGGNVVFDGGAEVAEVLVHVGLEEGVLVGGEDDFFEFRPDIGDGGEVDTAVEDTEELMDLGLVCPLCEEGCDGVVPPIENEKDGWCVRLSEIEQGLFLCDLIANFGGQLLGHQAGLLKSYKRVLLERQKKRDDPFGRPLQGVCVPYIWAMAPQSLLGKAEIEGHQIWIDNDIVRKVLLNSLDDLVVICLCQSFQ